MITHRSAVKILSSIAMLILPACTSSQTKSRPTDFFSALCPKPVVSFRQGFSEADQAFFRFLGAMGPEHPDRILILEAPYTEEDLLKGLWWLQPGGFLLVNDAFGVAMKYFKPRNWERLPFLWKDYSIYRKPLQRIEASA